MPSHIEKQKIEPAMAQPKPNCAELRQQILSNAMNVFPKVVQAYFGCNAAIRAKAEDVFDIATAKEWGGEIRACITYGDQCDFRLALQGNKQASYYEALHDLLEATEWLLDQKMEQAKLKMGRRESANGTWAAEVDRDLF